MSTNGAFVPSFKRNAGVVGNQRIQLGSISGSHNTVVKNGERNNTSKERSMQ